MFHWQFDSMGFVESDTMVKISVDMAFEEFDKDRDDKLSLEEFYPVVNKQPLLLNFIH